MVLKRGNYNFREINFSKIEFFIHIVIFIILNNLKKKTYFCTYLANILYSKHICQSFQINENFFLRKK